MTWMTMAWEYGSRLSELWLAVAGRRGTAVAAPTSAGRWGRRLGLLLLLAVGALRLRLVACGIRGVGHTVSDTGTRYQTQGQDIRSRDVNPRPRWMVFEVTWIPLRFLSTHPVLGHLFPHPFPKLCENFSPRSFMNRTPAKVRRAHVPKHSGVSGAPGLLRSSAVPKPVIQLQYLHEKSI